jgi:F-type H+-transporting ATPase subunit b
MKSLTILLIILMPALVLAAGEEHVPFSAKLFTYQCINVGVMVIGLIYFLREGTAKFFKDKRAGYLAAAAKSQQAKQDAEKTRSEIQARLSQLENTADESIARARAEAMDMKKNLVAEAEALSRRLHNEAEKSVVMEVERAKGHLREHVIQESVAAARAQLASKVSQEDHQRLQGEFINHMQETQMGAQK